MANTTVRAIRIDDETWYPALARARSEHSDMSAEVRWFIGWLASPEMNPRDVRARYKKWARKLSEEGDTVQRRTA